jgi:rubrerythrin
MPGKSQTPDSHQTPSTARTPRSRQAPATTELPGDSVCWLRLVCTECGAIAESEPPTNCPQCGTPIEAAR